jgi:transcriptional regulator with XRE-family HTH domain
MESRPIRSLADLRAVAKARRRELRLTQAEAATAAGVSRQFVSGFERGQGGDLPATLRLLAAIDVTLLAVPGSQDATTATVTPAVRGTDGVGRPERVRVDLDQHLSAFDRGESRTEGATSARPRD